MKILMDTHVWLWTLSDSARLKPQAAAVLKDEANQIFLSPVSVWETLVLIQKGRFEISDEPRRWIERALAQTGAIEAGLTTEVAVASRFLKLPHDDPADRFLAATALVMGLKLATADKNLLRSKACELIQA